VDLPLPDGPAIARNSPSAMVRERSSKALTKLRPEGIFFGNAV